jgi:hypothetical protein
VGFLFLQQRQIYDLSPSMSWLKTDHRESLGFHSLKIVGFDLRSAETVMRSSAVRELAEDRPSWSVFEGFGVAFRLFEEFQKICSFGAEMRNQISFFLAANFKKVLLNLLLISRQQKRCNVEFA